MELQIQDLVSSIKKDGIDSANQQAAAILADARKQADAIIADAKSQADKLRDDARAEIEVFKNSAQLSAQQAQELKNGLELRPSKKVGAGFRLAAKDGSGYFDCSDQEIAEMLMPFFRDMHL